MVSMGVILLQDKGDQHMANGTQDLITSFRYDNRGSAIKIMTNLKCP